MKLLRQTIRIWLAAAALTACGNTPEESQPATDSSINQSTTGISSSVTTPAAVPIVTPEGETPSEFAALPAPFANADYARGRRAYRQCSSCHTSSEDGDHLVGPNLFGLFGRKVGGADGFSYSTALKDADFSWTPATLDEWLESPRGFLPGNQMTFSGIRRPADRQAVIAYLMIEAGWMPDE